MSGLDIPVEGKSIRQLCGIVLVFEAIVIGLAIPVAIVLEHTNHGLAAGIGGALAVCAILISGVVGRPRMGWALLAGTISLTVPVRGCARLPPPPRCLRRTPR